MTSLIALYLVVIWPGDYMATAKLKLEVEGNNFESACLRAKQDNANDPMVVGAKYVFCVPI